MSIGTDATNGVRCYNASDAELNSTAWFVNNIGSFVKFITLDDLTSFVSTSQVCPDISYDSNAQT